MRIALVAPESGRSLAADLEGAGLDVAPIEVPDPGDLAGGGLAAALRAAEAALESDRPAALVVAGAGDEALGAALTAVKLGIPTAWLRPDEPTAGLTGRVADLTLDATDGAPAIAAAIRELAAPTITAR